MGISGLLPFLKKASHEACIKDYKGCTVAIDSYCWLHKGAFSCADKLAMGEKTDQYVYYCMKFVNMLLAAGVKPIMVFDGNRLPSKAEVEKARRERRDAYRKKAAQLLREGKRAEARDCLTKCIDINPQMALDLMNACRAKGVDCIVAPYEADAQLAFLNQAGIAQVIITEDSDLILFGCEKVLYKMDMSGNGMMVEKDLLNQAMDLRPDSYTFEKFRYMCILSGCDYLASLHGIGLGKANKLFKLTRQADIEVVIKKMPATLRMSGLSIPGDYIDSFIKANNTFLYQLVYDPLKRKLVPLNPYPPEVNPEELDYAGPPMSPEKAYQMALGNIDLYTGKVFASFDPGTFKPKSQSWNQVSTVGKPHLLSIWDPEYQPMGTTVPRKDPVDVHRPGTKNKMVIIKRASLKRPRLDFEEDSAASDADLVATYAIHDTSATSSCKRSKLARCENLMESQSQGSVGKTGWQEGSKPDLTSYRYKTTLQEPVTPQQLSGHSQSPQVNGGGESPQVSGESESPQVSGHGKLPQVSEDRDSPQFSGDVQIKENILRPPKSPLTSPKHKFAVKASSKKERFNLNAKREVKVCSRFFSEKTQKPLPKTTFFLELSTQDSVDSKIANFESKLRKEGEIEESNQEASKLEKDVSQSQIKGSPDDSQSLIKSSHDDSQSQIKNSPYNSFAFGKRNKYKCGFAQPMSRFPSSTSGANKQIKLEWDRDEQSGKMEGSTGGTDSAPSQSSDKVDGSTSPSLLSQGVAVNSIDEDCFSLSDDASPSQSQSELPGLDLRADHPPPQGKCKLHESPASSSGKSLLGPGCKAKPNSIMALFKKSATIPQTEFLYPKTAAVEPRHSEGTPPLLPTLDLTGDAEDPTAAVPPMRISKLRKLGKCRQSGLSKSKRNTLQSTNIASFFTKHFSKS